MAVSHVQAEGEESRERNGARSEGVVSREGREKETKPKGTRRWGWGEAEGPTPVPG